ncbi:MAG: D-glycero-beta-D-manno-heptose 1-phosphate adenylyltransferase [Candidatus Sericytochromatia bacterium]
MDKVIKQDTAKKIAEKLKKENKKIVLTNGCFDILHIGHAEYLKEAKKLGDFLFVGINSDSSVKKLKGESRPINNEKDRAKLLSYLEFIDYAIIFEEKTADNIIDLIKPDIYVKGGDYTKESLPEYQTLLKYNSEIAFVNFVNGYSTTKILEKIKS